MKGETKQVVATSLIFLQYPRLISKKSYLFIALYLTLLVTVLEPIARTDNIAMNWRYFDFQLNTAKKHISKNYNIKILIFYLAII